MQAKKSKQLLKARLCRERQLYEMRKRAELKAAISELERPWEVVERAPVLFSISADEQIKALADRFQRPSGFDMWSERDGPRLFRSPDDIPSARFFPKHAVHSVKPYGVVTGKLADGAEEGEKVIRNDDLIAKGANMMGKGRREKVLLQSSSLESERSAFVEVENGNSWGNLEKSYCSDSELVVASSRKAKEEIDGHFGRRGGNRGSHGSDSDLAVYGSKMNGDDMVGDFGRRSGRDRNWGLDSGLVDAGSRFERQKMAVSFGRPGGGGSRVRHWDSYGSQSELAVNGSTMKRDKLARDFGRRDGGDRNQGSSESYSEFAVAGSRIQRKGMSGGFDRRRGRDRPGGNRGSHRLHSELEKEDNESGIGNRSGYRNAMAGGFDRRGSRGGNRGSYRSYSELAVVGSRIERDEGGIGNDNGYRNAMAGVFDRRGGRGGNRGSYRSYSELAVAGSRMEKLEIADDLGKRGSRCGNRNSYTSDSEIENADFRKGSFQNNYSDGRRVSLRPTTELKLEEGDDARRVTKWSEGRNNGFRIRRGTRRP